MIIRLKKAEQGTCALSYVRKDGSSTWQKASPYFALHDLMHYAVESTLGYKQAFLGLLASGKNIQDFEKNAKDWLPTEAMWAEIMTGQLQGVQNGAIPIEQIVEAVNNAADGLLVPHPSFSQELAERILARHAELMMQWHVLPQGEAMEVVWNE
jgi:hypothetical protein